MFVAENKEGQRFYSLSDDEGMLRSMGKCHVLTCPDCSSPVRFRSGTKIPHFYHQTACTNPNPYSEPESKEHRAGKLTLYNWLKELYPSSRVELEYFVFATKQRSDVMLIHSDGKMVALEFQCSKITGQLWRERHDLYISAGIQDIWILNSEILRYNSGTCKIISLEAEVFKQYNHLSYLNPEDESVTFIGDGLLDASRIYRAERFQDILRNIRILNEQLWLVTYANYLVYKEEEIRKQELAEIERKRINDLGNEARKAKEKDEEEFRGRIKVVNESGNAELFNEHYTDIIKNRHHFMHDFTPKELQLFNVLAKRYQLTKDNFPGMFHVNVLLDDLIQTPPQLWQLWIFDQIMNKRMRWIYKNKRDPKIWLDDMKGKFVELRKEGYLRTKQLEHLRENYIFTMYNYIDSLNKCGILQKLGSMTTKYQRILVDRIPMFESHKENALLKMYFEGYIHEKIMHLGKDFDEQIIQIQMGSDKANSDREEFVSTSTTKLIPDENVNHLIDEFTWLLKKSDIVVSRTVRDKCTNIIRHYFIKNVMDEESRTFLREAIQVLKTEN